MIASVHQSISLRFPCLTSAMAVASAGLLGSNLLDL